MSKLASSLAMNLLRFLGASWSIMNTKVRISSIGDLEMGFLDENLGCTFCS